MIAPLFWFVYSILKAEAYSLETENPVIRLNYTHVKNEEIIKVLMNKPLKIVIEDSNTRYVWCNNFYEIHKSVEFVPVSNFENNTHGIVTLNVSNVTAEMSTRWVCNTLQEYHGPPLVLYNGHNYTANQLFFHLHVKGTKPVIVVANNHYLTYVTANLSVTHDGDANFTYEDGEEINFSCKTPPHGLHEDSLSMEYYNAEGIRLFKTRANKNKPITFHSILKSTNNKYYLDYKRAVRNPDREYIYRTTFYMKARDFSIDPMEHGVILSVNGQKATAVFNDNTTYDDYVFRYIDGEILDITCRKTDFNMPGTLSFFEEDIKVDRKELQSLPEEMITLKKSTADVNNKTLVCGINNGDVQKPLARLVLRSDVRDHDVRIRGLPRNNILYQYSTEKDVLTIEYQYTAKESLNLTCVFNKGFAADLRSKSSFEWKFEGQSFITSPAIEIAPRHTTIRYSKTEFTKVLDESHNGTKIECIYRNYDLENAVEIILRLKLELDSKAETEEISSGEDKRWIVSLAAIAGVIVAIITTICLVCWRKRAKRVSLIENAYDNLSNENDSSIPAFPSQWESNYDDSNYAKIDEAFMQENYNYLSASDKPYKIPIKRQSNASENFYTEIEEYTKPKQDGVAANWNTAQPSKCDKANDLLKSTTSDAGHDEGTYDKLRHNNLPNNNGDGNYSNVQKPSKNKKVTFRKMSNDIRPAGNRSEGYSKEDSRHNDTRLKQNSDGNYADTGEENYMQKKPIYANRSIQNDKPVDPYDLDYDEPYSELELNCKNDFYG